ncbi:MAG: HAD family hydrolase [Candidatus Thermoplasmatota archaeon]|nr:HAD family hydrolase [Candidatus Thermoplasmatota archaeon]
MKQRRFKHVFVDAEGTLYVPKHGRSRWEFWMNPSLELALEFFELDEGVNEALADIRARSDTLCLVSRNSPEILYALLAKFGIRQYFDGVLLNGNKGKNISRYLSRRGLSKDEAIMVGDMPRLDIFPVKEHGIEAILVDRFYNRYADAERISGLKDLPTWLRLADVVDGIGRKAVRMPRLEEFAFDGNPNLDCRSTGFKCGSLDVRGEVT